MSLNLKYRQLKAFSLVVEEGSFVAAADRLAVTQPSFSALIKALEQDVDVQLFDRSTRRCVLTDAGRTFYEQIKTALDNLEHAYQNIKDIGSGTAGQLTLFALPSLAASIVTAALVEFRKAHPRVQIELVEQKNNRILEAIRNGEADIGIGSVIQESTELDFELLLTDHLMFVVPDKHPMTSMRPVWACANKFPLIVMNAGPVEHALKQNAAQPTPAYQVQHAATALAMVRGNLGITILPSSIGSDLNLDGLTCLPILGEMSTRQLGLITKKNVRPRAAAIKFAEVIRAQAR
ncbi:MAG TPA: LysR family transcriptional regulator [Eoetvoesiella sp.]